MLETLRSIEGRSLRAAALVSRLGTDGAALEELDRIVQRARGGSGPDRDVLLALVHARVTRDDLPVARLSAEAGRRGLVEAESVLSSDGAPRTLARLARVPEPLLAARWTQKLAHDPSCGRRGTRIRTMPIRERLLRDPRAEVIRKLLELDGTTLADVVRLAARRPCMPDVGRTVAASRWLNEPSVRKALVENPFTERWLARALAPTIAAGRRA
jgi:hypothetical protein